VARQWAGRILTAAIAAAVALGAVVLLRYAQLNGITAFERLLPAGVGLILGVAFMFVSRRQGLPSIAWAGLVALLAGVANSALASSLDSFGWFWIALGAACIVLGAFDLRAFLKSHPVATTEERS
jgi:peptidoglycan/LPS O-acetylase OafA/YrhL